MRQRDENSACRKVYLETFGCQMNVLDSQLVQGQLRALGYRFDIVLRGRRETPIEARR